MDMTGFPDGTQMVGRIGAILRSVSRHMPDGVATATVAGDCGIPRPTVHRLLASLAAQGFIDRDSETARWFLGPEFYLMGAAAAARFDVADVARDTVRLIARETGESSFFSVRRGDENVCVIREEGSFPLRSFVLYEGVRFPLGVASGGLAILSFLPDTEVASYLARVDLATVYGSAHSATELRERIALTRKRGYATNPALIVEGSWGMAAAVFNALNEPQWALCVTGVESRFTPARRRRIGGLLVEQAHLLTRRILQR